MSAAGKKNLGQSEGAGSDPTAMLLRSFRLPTMAGLYEEVMQRAEKEGWSHRRVLRHLCESEAVDRGPPLSIPLRNRRAPAPDPSRSRPPGSGVRHCAPRLRLIRRYLEKIQARHLPKSLMGQAITYALGQWSDFEHYLGDGRVEICNNLIENAIRPLKLGAKNYLFFGSRRGGELACVAYTLIENCKRHGLALREYLIEAMKALIAHGPGQAVEITPAKIAAARRRRDKTA